MNVHTIDLFCGCGGLGLGFQLANGPLQFDIVMGLDNDPAPLRVYNDNHPSSSKLPVGRLCDLSWFSHPAEFLLYYLHHFSHHKADQPLRDALIAAPIGFLGFLGCIAFIDQEFAASILKITNSSAYTEDFKLIAPKTLTTAICQSFFDTMRISRPSARGGLLPGLLPWAEEATALEVSGRPEMPSIDSAITNLIRKQLQGMWERELKHLRSSSQKQGRGLNASIAERVVSLVRFLESDTGEALRIAWLKWRTLRDSLRAQMCASTDSVLRELYEDGRRVQLVLGGPPCKGFSRIGRPVATSLHDQGTFSWSSGEFGDERNALFYQYVLVVSALRPDAFVFENVENFTSPLKHANNMDPPALLEEAIEKLSDESLHFTVYSDLVHAVNHAVPQTRIRYFMVGLNRASLSAVPSRSPLELPRYAAHVPLEVALRGLGESGAFVFAENEESADASFETSSYAAQDPDAPDSHSIYLSWVRQPDPLGQVPTRTDAHIYRKLRTDDLEMVKRFAPGQRWMDYTARNSDTVKLLRSFLSRLKNLPTKSSDGTLPSMEEAEELLNRCDDSLLLRLLAESAELPVGIENHLLKANYLSNGTGKHGDWFERLSSVKPCKTIVAHIGKDTYGYFHPYHPRAISIREAARVQSFPDWFRFRFAGVVQGYAMIGNAVPPLLAKHIASCLIDIHAECGLFQQKHAIGNQRALGGLAHSAVGGRHTRQQSLRFVDWGTSSASDQ